MIRISILALVAVSLAAPTATAAVLFDWAYIGNAGNAPDPQTGNGDVAYSYLISKYEVTNAQYATFLNTVAATDQFGPPDLTGFLDPTLYDPLMGSSIHGGITRSGVSGSYTYETKSGMADKPVVFVSYFDAMRFTNWLHNGQGSGGTETGVYTIGNGYNEIRPSTATYWIPNKNEWYKAAYHDASAGTAGVYFDYAAGSDTVPANAAPEVNPAGANYWPSPVAGLTEVGAYYEAVSPYGTFDQIGNVGEMTEQIIRDYTAGNAVDFRVLRGGGWNTESMWLSSESTSGGIIPPWGGSTTGFRIATLATIPEPGALTLAAVLTGWGVTRRKRQNQGER